METNSDQTKEKKYRLKNIFIKDHFYHKGNKIAILENKAFKNIDQNILILAKMIENENEVNLEPLTDEEYEQAIKKYDALVEMFDEEGNNG